MSRVRVCERHFLNEPGQFGSAFVHAFVEDTSERDAVESNFGPHTILEIADCSERVNLYFDISNERERVNSLHKLDVLIHALQSFRAGLVAEFAEYERREL